MGAEQQALLEKANRRGGRGRRNRKKTISDMSAMLSPSLTQDEMGETARLAMLSQTPDSKRSTFEYSFEGVEGLPDFPSNPSPDSGPSLTPRAQRRHSGHRIQAVPQRRSSGQRIQIPESITALDDSASNLVPEIDLKSLRKPTVPG